MGWRRWGIEKCSGCVGYTPQRNDRIKEKRVLEDNAANITRNGKHYKPTFLEEDNPGRNMEEGFEPVEPKEKEVKEEEYRVLTQSKKTQAFVSM